VALNPGSLLALAAGVRVAEELGLSIDEERDEMNALRRASEKALGVSLADHLWQKGRHLPLDEIIPYIESRPPIKRP